MKKFRIYYFCPANYDTIKSMVIEENCLGDAVHEFLYGEHARRVTSTSIFKVETVIEEM